MSLYKQFWLFILFLALSAYVGSFVFSCISAQQYLQEHLTQKNNDNALTLALSLSSGEQDKVSMELAINSQFDLGHYHFISLVDTQGNIIAARYDDREYNEAPQWLIKLFPITIEPGVASVNSGWQQVGSLTLSSHVRFAYQQLWQNVKQLLFYFTLLTLGFCILGSVALRWLSKPLQQAVEQASAIGEKRFVTSEEPRTPELRKLIRSLNKLSTHVKHMLDNESAKLENLKAKTQYDELTGLNNRSPLLGKLSSLLQKKNELSGGTLVLARIVDLFNLNQSIGRPTMDTLLRSFGEVITKGCADHSNQATAGRLNGSDFLVIIPAAEQAEESARDLHQRLLGTCKEQNLNQIQLLCSTVRYCAADSISTLLSKLDNGLQQLAESTDQTLIFVDLKATTDENDTYWEKTFENAFKDKLFQLDYLQVFDTQGELIHKEASIELQQTETGAIDAPAYMPHISRLGLNNKLDSTLLEMALNAIKNKQGTLAIQLSIKTISSDKDREALVACITRNADYCKFLSIEIPEYHLFKHLDAIKAMSEKLIPIGCKLGIANGGQEIMQIGKVHKLGLNYLKIDPYFIADIPYNSAHQAYLRGFVTILHSIGMKAIAENVSNSEEWDILKQLGVDGGSGSFFINTNNSE